MEGSTVCRYWDVEGVPVLEVRRPNGGGGWLAIDFETPRRFPGDAVWRNGANVSEERFAELFPEAVPRIASALIASKTGL